MTNIYGRHFEPKRPFVGFKPGDWRFSDEDWNVLEPGATPKWLRFGCPLGHGECSVPLAPQRTGAGHTWHWNGDRERPTLNPSINCLAQGPNGEKYGGCGWHGFLRAGVFEGVT